jgi:hypothetical protein
VAVLAGAQVYSDRSQEEQDQPGRGRDADVPDAHQPEQQARGPGDLERAECRETIVVRTPASVSLRP